MFLYFLFFFFFFNDTATTEIYTLSLHDALPISVTVFVTAAPSNAAPVIDMDHFGVYAASGPKVGCTPGPLDCQDRKSTRLNSSHSSISYAVFCLKKKKKKS